MYLPGWLPTGIEDEKKTHFLMALDGLDDLFSTTIGIYSNKLQIIGFIFFVLLFLRFADELYLPRRYSEQIGHH